MRALRALMVGAALAALAITPLAAQTIGQQSYSGNECWNVGQGPGGPSTGFACMNATRNGQQNIVLSAVAGNFTVGVTSTNTTPNNITGITNGGNLLINAQPSAAVITLPASPLNDGIVISICNVTGSAWATNAVTLAANSNQTLAVAATLTTLAAGTCAQEQWNLAAATWYRIR